MKNILIMLILIFNLVPYLTRYVILDVYPEEVKDILSKKYLMLNKYVHDCKRVYNWIYTNIYYRAEPEGKDTWQSPEETLRKKAGDCEDKAILFEYLIRRKYWFMPVQYQSLNIPGEKYKHIIVIVGDYIYGISEDQEYTMTKKHGILYAWYRQTFPQLAELLRRIF